MFPPLANGLDFVYPKYDLSSKKDQNILLTKAANKEIDGDGTNAKFIYSRLENNPEAEAHLKRIETDINSHRPQKLLNLATVAEAHGSLNTAFHVYSELLLQTEDDVALTTASQCLAHEKFKGYVIAGR